MDDQEIRADQRTPVLSLRSWALNEQLLDAIIAQCRDVAGELHGESDVSDVHRTIREAEAMKAYLINGAFELIDKEA